MRGGRTRRSESSTPGSTDAAPLPSRRHCESGTGTGDVARSAQSTWTNETERGGGHGKGRGRAVVAARASVGRAWAAEAGKGTARSARAGRLRARRQPQAPSRWSNETEQSAAARAGRAASGGWLRGGRTRRSESSTPGSTDAAPLPSRRHCESGTRTPRSPSPGESVGAGWLSLPSRARLVTDLTAPRQPQRPLTLLACRGAGAALRGARRHPARGATRRIDARFVRSGAWAGAPCSCARRCCARAPLALQPASSASTVAGPG